MLQQIDPLFNRRIDCLIVGLHLIIQQTADLGDCKIRSYSVFQQVLKIGETAGSVIKPQCLILC